MQIVMNKKPQAVTLQDFAKQHNLVMEVNERNVTDPRSVNRYYAHFQRCEVKEKSVIVGVSGNGATPHSAIRRYAEQISNKTLVFDAMGRNRKEMLVPKLTYKADCD